MTINKGFIEPYKTYKGYIIAPGITMPGYNIYEYEVFENFGQYEEHNPAHAAESEAEAEQWVDRQAELGGAVRGKDEEKPPPDLEECLTRLTELQAALDKTLDEPRGSHARTITRPKLIKELGQAVEEARSAGMTDDDVNELVAELEITTGKRPIELENFWDPRRMTKGWRRGESGNPYPPRKGIIPKLPEEARGDFLFYEYIRDLCKYEALSEEDVQRLWEGYRK